MPKKNLWDRIVDAWDDMENDERADVLEYLNRDYKRILKRDQREAKRKAKEQDKFLKDRPEEFSRPTLSGAREATGAKPEDGEEQAAG